MTHLMFEIHLLLGCEVVCGAILSRGIQGCGVLQICFFFLIEISVESQVGKT